MRKIFFAIIIALVALTSCNTQFGIAYGVKFTGDGDGKFAVTFPQGYYAMDGTAAIALIVGDTIPFNNPDVTTKAQVIESGSPKQLKALQEANDFIADQFSSTAGSGTYDLWIKGFVKEIGTGLVFEVDRHLTNRTPQVRKAAKPEDLYPYIK